MERIKILLSAAGRIGACFILISCSSEPRTADGPAPEKSWPASFGYGRTATAEEISSIDIDVRPDGKGLPSGSGSALQGKIIFEAKCAVCHGAGGKGGAYAALVTDAEKPKVKTIGNYWPYPTTVYDYINRAMPLTAPGSLTPEEVYSLTAYLLYANGIIREDQIMDARTLPKIKMPAQHLFVADDRTGGKEIR